MKIIITGGTGSLGASLTRYLASHGQDVTVVGRTDNPPTGLLACAKYVRADISKPFALPDADVCIHCAALTSDTADPELLHTVNVTGTENVVRAAIRSKMFIHISSSSVYASANEPITEDTLSSPQLLSAYGKSKLQSEGIIQDIGSQPAVFILRPRAIYGPGDRVLLPRLLELVQDGKMMRPGKMDAKLSMTHFANMSHAIDCCIRSGKKGFHTYNVSDQNAYVLYDVIKPLMDEIFGNPLPEKEIPIWLIKSVSALGIKKVSPFALGTLTKNFVLDISKIQKELNYQPQANFGSALSDIGRWVKSMGGPESVRRAEVDLPWR